MRIDRLLRLGMFVVALAACTPTPAATPTAAQTATFTFSIPELAAATNTQAAALTATANIQVSAIAVRAQTVTTAVAQAHVNETSTATLWTRTPTASNTSTRAPTSTPPPTYTPSVTFTPPGTPTLPPTATPVHAPDRVLGPSNAFLTIIMYGDFQSALCLDVARSIEIIRETDQADVRLIWRDFPQPENDKAQLAAQAAAAAADEGKFWEMHDQLLTHQSEWAPLSVDQFHAKLADYAKTVGLDATKFYAAIDGGTELPALKKAIADAQALGFKGAPVLLFNGLPYSGRIDLYALDNYTRLRLLEKRWFAHQPALQIDLSKQYTATLTTEKGAIQIALDPKAAPVAVNNFVFLARDGWYNAITFHLVIPGVLAQTGDPSGSGLGGPGYTIADEFNNGYLFDRAGQVAMAGQRESPNSAGSQFFVTMAPLRPEVNYDNQFTIFGHVTSGLDVLSKLTPRNPFDEQNYPNPPPGDKLISVTIQQQ